MTLTLNHFCRNSRHKYVGDDVFKSEVETDKISGTVFRCVRSSMDAFQAGIQGEIERPNH